jgi:heme A synthase
MVFGGLMMALLFTSTVLSYMWWNSPLIHRYHQSKNSQEKWEGSNRQVIPQHKDVDKLQSQQLVQLKRIFNWSELINKKVKTCEID